MLKKTTLLISFLCMNSIFFKTYADPIENEILKPTESRYELGLGIVEIERIVTLDWNHDHYIINATSTVSGLAALVGYGPIIEESQFVISDNGRILPKKYKRVDESGSSNLNKEIVFDWKLLTAESRFGDQTLKIEIQPGTLDPLTVVLQARLDLKSGLKIEKYLVHEAGMLKEYKISYLESEKIDVGNHKLDALHLMIDTGRPSRKLHYWLAPQLDYLPIKMQQSHNNEAEFTTNLTSTSRSR